MVEIESTLGKTTMRKVEAFEASLGHRLPEQYKRFLLEYNGGEPEYTAFDIPSTGGSDIVEQFYGICNDEDDNLLTVYEDYRGQIPSNLLPIAFDPFGNEICISIAGNDTGKIYFWDHETAYGDNTAPDYHNVTLLANSFDEFLASLHPDTDDIE